MMISLEKKWLVEAISWVFAFIACMFLLAPILFAIQDYPFLVINVISILAAVYYTRLIFLKHLVPFGDNKVFMLIVVFTTIPIVFLLVANLFTVQGYINETGLYTFLKTLPESQILSLSNYIKFEVTFVTVWAIVAATIAPFVMIKSIWRLYKSKHINKL